ncbi:MAG: AAA family ATPase [Acetobacteraceae bacterium]|nr:AAA family ATPase [Acetobacteraceae bacterium]
MRHQMRRIFHAARKRRAIRRFRSRRGIAFAVLLALGLAGSATMLGLRLFQPAAPAAELRAVPTPMPFSTFTAALERGDVAKVAIGISAEDYQRALVTMRDGSRHLLRAPVEWLPKDAMLAHGVEISFDIPREALEAANAQQASAGSVLVAVMEVLAPLLLALLLGTMLFMALGHMRRMRGSAGRLYEPDASRRVAFQDVAGQDAAKAELGDVLAYLRDPHRFDAVGAKPPRGVLLLGPPGTGKTLLARALAGAAGVPFFHASGSDFVEMFVGVGASRVRRLFERARKHAPCIVFIDEIDTVGAARTSGAAGGDREHNQTITQLLTAMDGIESSTGVVVIGATNFAEALDPALLRPGRFDRHVTVGLPTLAERAAILRVHARGKPLAADVDLDGLAQRSGGMSGADLESLLNAAAVLAARDGRKEITRHDIEAAFDTVLIGAERDGLRLSEHDKRVTAVHEAGHALVALRMPASDPLHKVTVLPRGQALGVAVMQPDGERVLETRARLKARLAYGYGGRVAEEVIFGREVASTGAQGDLVMVTDLARRMVLEWGLGEDEGGSAPLSWSRRQAADPTVSRDAQLRLERSVQRLADEAYARATEILTRERAGLLALAEALLERETLTGDEARAVVDRALQPAD